MYWIYVPILAALITALGGIVAAFVSRSDSPPTTAVGAGPGGTVVPGSPAGSPLSVSPTPRPAPGFKFRAVEEVPFCSNMEGTGGSEGHRYVALFVRAHAAPDGPYYFERPVRFRDPEGPWVAEQVHVGAPDGDVGTRFDVIAVGLKKYEPEKYGKANEGLPRLPGEEIEWITVTRTEARGVC